jgi:hypothetical protein
MLHSLWKIEYIQCAHCIEHKHKRCQNVDKTWTYTTYQNMAKEFISKNDVKRNQRFQSNSQLLAPSPILFRKEKGKPKFAEGMVNDANVVDLSLDRSQQSILLVYWVQCSQLYVHIISCDHCNQWYTYFAATCRKNPLQLWEMQVLNLCCEKNAMNRSIQNLPSGILGLWRGSAFHSPWECQTLATLSLWWLSLLCQ